MLDMVHPFMQQLMDGKRESIVGCVRQITNLPQYFSAFDH
jgi:hypothetical protein